MLDTATGPATETQPDTTRWEDDSPTAPQSFGETCADCGSRPPRESEDYTLMCLQGWRISRQRGRDGSFLAEWRCPACWRAYGARRSSSRPGAR